MPEAPTTTQRWGGYRWYALALLSLVALVNYLDRFVFAVIIEEVKREFGASDFALGLLSGAAFALFYATLGIPIARWADGGNRRRIIVGALALWSAMTALCGLATTFPLLVLAIPGLALAALIALTLREPRTDTAGPLVGLRGLRPALARLMTQPSYRWLCTAFALWGFVTYGVAQWFVPYLLRVRGLDLVAASSRAGLISAIAPAAGTLVGGWLADRLAQRSAVWLGRLPALCCSIALPLYLLAGATADIRAMLVLVATAGFLIGLMVPAGYTALHVVAGATDRAMGVAVAFFFLNFVGYGAGPAAIGLASDLLAPSFGPNAIAVALGLALLMLAPSAFAFWRAGRLLVPAPSLPSRGATA